MTTIDILDELGKANGIAYFKYVKFPSSVLIQDSVNCNPKMQGVISQALNIRANLKLPFWESFNICLPDFPSLGNITLPLVDHHNYLEDDKWISTTEIKELIHSTDNIGVMSKVRMTDGSEHHIPMLDFHIPVSDNAIDVVEKVCRCLGLEHGAIINSGASYHFIGYDLLSTNQLHHKLYHALLYGPITDARWIAHQLIEGACTLRITQKNGIYPTLIKEL
ncbi:MAG: hypothetical protein NC453_22340 [Muribaculum sp.]|nr:hypothetical protein [Muribaculum sp.]